MDAGLRQFEGNHGVALSRERRCNTHWCWACGHAAEEAAVYDHMWREHGGIGLEDDGAYEGDEADEGYIIRPAVHALTAAPA